MLMEQRVYKSNALIESSYRLGIMEQRLVLSCIAQVRRDEKEVTDEVLYKVTASELAELSGGRIENIYSKLKEASLKLLDRKIWIKGEPNGKGEKSKVMVTRWVQTVTYNDNLGEVELRFGKDVLPYISQLKSHFTSYKLKDIGCMDSAHAVRLFELLIQYRDIGQRDIDLDELKEQMQLQDKYAKTAELKRWVIDPAIKQINKHTSLKASYTQRKAGRKIVAFIFSFKEKKEKINEVIDQLPQEQPKKALKSQSEADKLARPGEEYSQLFARLKREGYALKFKPSY
jgi:plasmid replication initiation protein